MGKNDKNEKNYLSILSNQTFQNKTENKQKKTSKIKSKTENRSSRSLINANQTSCIPYLRCKVFVSASLVFVTDANHAETSTWAFS